MIQLPRVIGHRGVAAHAPENTLAGFKAAAAFGLDWVEFDVRLSQDGVPVLVHDDTLERTTNGTGPVVARTVNELKRLDAGSWFGPSFAGETVLTLAEALDAIHELGMRPNIEVKTNPGEALRTGRAVGATLDQAWPPGRPRPLVSSFVLRCLMGFRQARPDLPTALNVWRRSRWQWSVGARVLGCVSVHFSERHVTDAQIRAVKAAGRQVVCYTVNDAAKARSLFARGVDAVFTDMPDEILPAVPTP